MREICVGHAWSFGKERAGNLELLRRLGQQWGFAEVGVPAVSAHGEIISSTFIRAAVERGDFPAAQEMLGRPYTILGTVQHGEALGRTIGFPTANLAAHNEQFPPNGVYAVTATLERLEGLDTAPVPPAKSDGELSGSAGGNLSPSTRDLHARMFRGVANIGVRPTIRNGAGERVFEVHLFDFDGDLYRRDLEVEFREWLRAEQKFVSLGQLQQQIVQDCEMAKRLTLKTSPASSAWS